jgi:hypothetical protein
MQRLLAPWKSNNGGQADEQASSSNKCPSSWMISSSSRISIINHQHAAYIDATSCEGLLPPRYVAGDNWMQKMNVLAFLRGS